MNKIKSLATEHPLVFGIYVTLVFILMVLISSIVVSAIWPAETYGWYIGSTIARLVAIFVLLMVLAHLGWSHSAGFTRLGHRLIWLILPFLLVYAILASAYTMTGNLDFNIADPTLTGLATLFLLTHAFLEEVAFRGLILHGFVRTWGSEHRGMLTSVLVAALFFGAMHIIYLAAEPLPVVLMRSVVAFLLGVLLGALVLSAGSIYPAAFFHGVLNIAGFLNITSNGIEGTPSAWLLMSLFMLPLAIFGVVLQSNFPQRSALVKAEPNIDPQQIIEKTLPNQD